MTDQNAPISDELSYELQQAFKLFDKEENGTIAKEDFVSVLRALRISPAEGEVHAMIQSIGGDEDGNLTYDAFERCMASKMHSPETEEEVLQVFKQLDQSHTGLISEVDLRRTIKTLLHGIKREELDEIIRGEVHVNEDGMVDYTEFVKTLISNS
eukprot:CAMPEP_0197241800 /NCGR_PEP_ID=MMETSP1429-20130617/7741_1 /TAXON_ID=49237 /ORGANISM="Chaetoceros  sp., Strain UNC1202" /LENGTH=154 /DNA_ID=CAMNT_0042701699 /DNA_START=68 /DNA_END=532 /DNA_ORIENTATION=+